MTTPYWNQWSNLEIMSMHGIEFGHSDDIIDEIDCDDSCVIETARDYCPYCSGNNCSYCLAITL